MNEAFVQLRCPECQKGWEENPSELPDPESAFICPDCGTRQPIAEFARTDTDLETLRQFSESGQV